MPSRPRPLSVDEFHKAYDMARGNVNVTNDLDAMTQEDAEQIKLRFRLIEEALEDPGLKRFYKMLWTSEAKHGHIFVKMLFHYFEQDPIYKRLDEMVAYEAEVLQSLPIRPALH